MEHGAAHSDVEAAFKAFQSVDRNADGVVQLGELCRVLDVDKDSPFKERVFAVLDLDGDGKLDFMEYVLALAQFVSDSHADRVRFAYRLFDVDKSTSISREEFETVLRSLFTRTTNDRNVMAKRHDDVASAMGKAKGGNQMYDAVDRDASQALDLKEFEELIQRFPNVLAPANQIWENVYNLAKPCARVMRAVVAHGHDLDDLTASVASQDWGLVYYCTATRRAPQRHAHCTHARPARRCASTACLPRAPSPAARAPTAQQAPVGAGCARRARI